MTLCDEQGLEAQSISSLMEGRISRTLCRLNLKGFTVMGKVERMLRTLELRVKNNRRRRILRYGNYGMPPKKTNNKTDLFE